MLERNVMGFDGLVWFIGVIESRQDPLALGRVKVRAYTVHSASLTDIPSDDLPWAIVAQSANYDGIPSLKEADVVWGIFADGRDCQIPIVMFKLPGYNSTPNNQGYGFNDLRNSNVLKTAPRLVANLIYSTNGSGITVNNPPSANVYPLTQDLNKPTLSGVSRYDIANTVYEYRKNNLDKNIISAGGITWSEPFPAYNPLYPYNKVLETESGHLIEYDDTPGNERITFTHRAGSFIDFYPSGTRVDKITKSKYEIVMGDDNIHVMGRCAITIGEGAHIKVLGNASIEVDNNLNLTSNGDMNISVGGQFNLVANSLNQNIKGDATLVTSGTQYFTPSGQFEVKSAGTVDIDGSTINIDQGSAQSGTPNGLNSPGAVATPNSGRPTAEPVPVPFPINYKYLDQYTAKALQQSQYLSTSNTGAVTTPDANSASVSKCSFDVNTHTFLPSSVWAISENGLLFIKSNEGYAKRLANGSCQAYGDPVLGNSLLTIGYGCTQTVLGYQLTPDTIRTKAQADQDILDAINNIFLPKLQELVTVSLTQNMIDALLDFMYNIGPYNFEMSSVLKYTNQQNWCSAGFAFQYWTKAGGQVVPGLVNRRNKESNLYLT